MTDEDRISQAQLEKLLAARPDLLAEMADASFDSPFLRLMVAAERQNLARSFKERSCEPGEIVFHEGQTGDTMYVIWAGMAAVVKGKLDAKSPTILAYRGAGDVIGEMAVLEERPRSASVIALEPLRLFGVDRQGFQALLNDTPSVGMQIMGMLSARLRSAGEAQAVGRHSERRLVDQVSVLKGEKQRLQEVERLRQETNDLIIHDLRNPISSIGITLKMLTVTLPEQILKDNNDLLAIAQSSSSRLQRLVDSLLEIANLETGETQFLWDEMNLGHVLSQVSSKFDPNGKDISLQVEIETGLPTLIADEDKIRQVLKQLLENAARAIGVGGIIRLAVGLKDENTLAVSVSDSGPVIPEDRRKRVFDRFAQTSDTGPSSFGLGLAYCRLTVEAHGGHIWVEPAQDGVGNCFIFTLPLKSPSE